MSRDIIYLVIGSSHGRMAQLVVPTGTFSRMRDVDVNRLLASRSLESTESSPKSPNILGEIVRKVRIRSHGSVGRTSCPVQPTISRGQTQGRMAQLVEHIVHIDGVTGSSPVATTTRLASLLVRFFLTLPSYAKGCESHGEIRLS